MQSAKPTSLLRRCRPGESFKLLLVLLPGPREFSDFFRALRRQIFRLGAVRGHIVQLPGFVMVGDELPIADADGSIAIMIPPEIFVRDSAVFGKSRHQTFAWRRRNGFAVDALRPNSTCQFQNGRREVNDMAWRMAQLAVP